MFGKEVHIPDDLVINVNGTTCLQYDKLVIENNFVQTYYKGNHIATFEMIKTGTMPEGIFCDITLHLKGYLEVK